MKMRADILAVVFFLLVRSAMADEGEAKFSLKETEAPTGTRINRNIIVGDKLPLNKGYAEMTPSQQAVIRNWYEHLEADDEPPYPLHGMTPVYRRIGEAQQRLMAKGPLRLDVEVDSAGAARKITVLETPDPAVTRFVAAVLMNETYKPALCAGRPCTMSLPFLFNFTTRY